MNAVAKDIFPNNAVSVWLISANDLLSGQVVYQSPLIVDAHLHTDKTLTLTHFRNRFRESGPTHRSY